MKIFANVVQYPMGSTMVFLLATIRTVFGCGMMPAGQARTVTFIVTGLTLPVAMVYTEEPSVVARVPGIATNEAGAKAFVERLVMQTTTNIIMANWSNAMWQSVVNRAIRMLAWGPFGSHFFSAFATVN
ncbi:hypothetical protein KIN20_035314 [Parelaphostrongylus tenuis]|uniref:Uncharacterized protein n=1 Tax=Parelaphostrongylus tenuis TaxID=148309 RepID=A0AAD5WKC5_PARTN|nr:hypothetical protein KIN20_035314 [Parelaphostrongylus tenuis]